MINKTKIITKYISNHILKKNIYKTKLMNKSNINMINPTNVYVIFLSSFSLSFLSLYYTMETYGGRRDKALHVLNFFDRWMGVWEGDR
jgi:hypothetical protein